jgi:hypothetical protein
VLLAVDPRVVVFTAEELVPVETASLEAAARAHAPVASAAVNNAPVTHTTVTCATVNNAPVAHAAFAARELAALRALACHAAPAHASTDFLSFSGHAAYCSCAGAANLSTSSCRLHASALGAARASLGSAGGSALRTTLYRVCRTKRKGEHCRNDDKGNYNTFPIHPHLKHHTD